MEFPIRSDGISEDLVKRYLVNCESDNEAVTNKCRNLMEERGRVCGPKPAAVVETEADYKQWAKKFSGCLFPKPICAGVEVDSLARCKR